MHEMLSTSSTSPVLPILVNTRHQTTSTPLAGGGGDDDAFIKIEKNNENDSRTSSVCATTTTMESNNNNNRLENFLFQSSKPYYTHQTFSFNNYLNTNPSICNQANVEYTNTNNAVAMAAALQHYNMNNTSYGIIEPQINTQNSYFHHNNPSSLGGWQAKNDAVDYYRTYENVVAQTLEATTNEQSLNVRASFFPYCNSKSQSSIIEPTTTNVAIPENNYYYHPNNNNSAMGASSSSASYIYNQLPLMSTSSESKQRYDSVSSSTSSSSSSSSSSSILNHLSPIQDIMNNNNNKKPKLSPNLISSIKIENASNFQPSSSSSSSSVSSSSSFNSSPSSSSSSSSSSTNPKHLTDTSLSPKISNMTQSNTNATTTTSTTNNNDNISVSSTTTLPNLSSGVDIAMGLGNLSSSISSNSYTSSNNICSLTSSSILAANANSNHNTSNTTESYDWMKPVKTQSNGKTRTKDKYRVVYSEPQRVELEKEFLYSKYITIKRKAELSQTLSLSERQIKIWFQNRRAKERKSNRKHKHDHSNLTKSGVDHIGGSSSSSSSSSSSASSHSSSYGHVIDIKSRNYQDDDSAASECFSDAEDDFDNENGDMSENDTSSISNNTPKKTAKSRVVKSKPKFNKTTAKKMASVKYPHSSNTVDMAPSIALQGETNFQIGDVHQEESLMPRYNFNAYNQSEFDHQTNQSSSLLASFINNQSNVYGSSTSNTFSNQYSIFNPVEISSVNVNGVSSYNLNSASSHYYQPSGAGTTTSAFNHHPQSYNFINNSCQTPTSEYSSSSSSSYPLHTSSNYQSQFGHLSSNTVGNYSSCGSNTANFLPTSMKQIITSSPLSNNSVENANGNMMSHF